jgi:hypothetical protein
VVVLAFHLSRGVRGRLKRVGAELRECAPITPRTVCFDCLRMSSDDFHAAVLRELAFLVDDYGFRWWRRAIER